MPEPLIELEITGLDEARANLVHLGDELRHDIAPDAVRAATTVFEGPMRAAAPRGRRGRLQKAIASEVRSYRGGSVAFGIVGPSVEEASVANIIHSGTDRIAPNPFVDQTFVNNQSRALSVLSSTLAAGIEAEAAA